MRLLISARACVYCVSVHEIAGTRDFRTGAWTDLVAVAFGTCLALHCQHVVKLGVVASDTRLISGGKGSVARASASLIHY